MHRCLCLLCLLAALSCGAGIAREPGAAGSLAGSPVAAPSLLHAWDFDEVQAPALPEGWQVRVSGGVPAWRSVIGRAESLPNAAHVPAGERAGVSALYSPVLELPLAASELRFRHRWVVDQAPHEGGVLEIAIDGGEFVDIGLAGGRFHLGGYNNTLFRCCGGNPMGGRNAWSSPSQEHFITTRVSLPFAAAGRTVQLRWRFGSGEGSRSTTMRGWWIDSIELRLVAPPSLSRARSEARRAPALAMSPASACPERTGARWREPIAASLSLPRYPHHPSVPEEATCPT